MGESQGKVALPRSFRYQILLKMEESQERALPNPPQYQIPLRMEESQEEERALPRSPGLSKEVSNIALRIE